LLRPRRQRRASVVVMTDLFPKISETFIIGEVRALERLGEAVAIEALRRPTARLPLEASDPPAHFQNEDGRRIRVLAFAWLLVRHPLRCLRDRLDRKTWQAEEPVMPLRHLAPIAWRVHRSGAPRMHVHFAAEAALAALRIGRILGTPWSLTAHAYDIFYLPTNLVAKLNAADFVTTGCAYNVDYLRSLLPANPDKVHEIVMGIRPADFTRVTAPRQGRRVIAVGRLVEKKGFGDLIRAAALLRARGEPIEVVIVGDGPLDEELRQIAEHEGVAGDVRFAGALPPAQVRDELEMADVLACPCIVASHGDRDSMPVVVKEAMAMELPVVGSDAVGLPEMIDTDRGRLFPAGDVAGLADALTAVLALDAAARAELGAAGRAWVHRFADVDAETRKLQLLMR
jgi:glycosyltransferase involved in cell wall biosynthesis